MNWFAMENTGTFSPFGRLFDDDSSELTLLVHLFFAAHQRFKVFDVVWFLNKWEKKKIDPCCFEIPDSQR